MTLEEEKEEELRRAAKRAKTAASLPHQTHLSLLANVAMDGNFSIQVLIAAHKAERERAAAILQCKARSRAAKKKVSQVRAKKKAMSKKSSTKRRMNRDNSRKRGSVSGRSGRGAKQSQSEEGGAAMLIQNRQRQRQARKRVEEIKEQKSRAMDARSRCAVQVPHGLMSRCTASRIRRLQQQEQVKLVRAWGEQLREEAAY